MDKQKLNEKWAKASVAGSLWAAFEIVIGSFLHNIHFPFTGPVMASTGVIILISFSVCWEDKNIFWRAGIVCAIMKSISPGAVILGPMIGILSEAFLMQAAVLIFSRSLTGYVAGGISALVFLVIHQAISLLIIYGPDFVVVINNTAAYVLKSVSISNISPLLLLYSYIVLLALSGAAAAVTGYAAGKRATSINRTGSIKISDESLKEYLPEESKGGFLLPAVILSVIAGLYISSRYETAVILYFTAVFVPVIYLLYPSGIKVLVKPSVLLNLFVLVLFSVFFFNINQDGIGWSLEGLLAGVKMICRAVIVISGFSAISIELRNPVIRNLLNEKSVVYEAVQTGFSILPSLISGMPPVSKIMRNPLNIFSERIADADYFIKTRISNGTNNN